jgi:hypothetical protein
MRLRRRHRADARAALVGITLSHTDGQVLVDALKR